MQQLLTQVFQYTVYLDERLLSVPSSPLVDLEYPLDVYASIRWFALPAHWLQLGQDFLETIKPALI